MDMKNQLEVMNCRGEEQNQSELNQSEEGDALHKQKLEKAHFLYFVSLSG